VTRTVTNTRLSPSQWCNTASGVIESHAGLSTTMVGGFESFDSVRLFFGGLFSCRLEYSVNSDSTQWIGAQCTDSESWRLGVGLKLRWSLSGMRLRLRPSSARSRRPSESCCETTLGGRRLRVWVRRRPVRRRPRTRTRATRPGLDVTPKTTPLHLQLIMMQS
jgi:hypothetical protein